MNFPVRYEARRVYVDGAMTIYTCGELKPALIEELAAHPETTGLDLSGVSELDTAGLQLLLMARRHADARGQDLHVVNPSRVVAEVLELCRLGADLVIRAAVGTGVA
jgi:anti-anti-sigma factor